VNEMEKINSTALLKAAIVALETQQNNEGKILKEQYMAAYESIKPVNLIKNTFREVTASPDLKDELFNTSIGLAAGYLSKMLFQGASHSPVRKLFGTVLMFGITNAVAKHPEVIKAAGKGLLKIVAGGLATGDRDKQTDNRREEQSSQM
jgi:hypothetical protein